MDSKNIKCLYLPTVKKMFEIQTSRLELKETQVSKTPAK